MWIGWIELDLRLGDVHSLKAKRSVVRPIVTELQRRLKVSVAESASVDLHRRAGIAAAAVSVDRAHVVELLEHAERIVLDHPEVEVLSTRQRILAGSDVA